MTPTELRSVHKILLVDDDDAVRDMMTATLEHEGFEVVSARSQATLEWERVDPVAAIPTEPWVLRLQ
jgi:DNA-binding response OmpR family regulator